MSGAKCFVPGVEGTTADRLAGDVVVQHHVQACVQIGGRGLRAEPQGTQSAGAGRSGKIGRERSSSVAPGAGVTRGGRRDWVLARRWPGLVTVPAAFTDREPLIAAAGPGLRLAAIWGSGRPNPPPLLLPLPPVLTIFIGGG